MNLLRLTTKTNCLLWGFAALALNACKNECHRNGYFSYPDLSIETDAPTSVVAGSPIQILCTIKNNPNPTFECQTLPAPSTKMNFLIIDNSNASVIGTQSYDIAALNTGENVSIPINLAFQQSGNYQIQVSIDPDTLIREFNKSNNFIYFPITVY